MHKIRFYLRLMGYVMTHPFRRTYISNICGHPTKRSGFITALGERLTLSMPLAENNRPDYCLACIAKMSIKCAWCENPIHDGDPVTLYMPNESFEIPKHAVKYQDDTRCLVGCIKGSCSGGAIDRQGFWIPPGKVGRVPSPIEMALANCSEGEAVFVQDLSDPNNLGVVI